MKKQLAQQPFIPILLGGNLGSYSTARSFYEAYGVTSIIICTMVTGPIDHSLFIETLIEKSLKDPDILFPLLNKLEQDYPDTKKLILGSADNHIELIVQNKSRIPSEWIVPYVDKEKFYYGTDKESFYAICERIGVPYPKTHVIDELDLELPFGFPIVIKPSNSMKYHDIDFPGKMKAYICRDQDSYQKIVHDIRSNGYDDSLILQEYIPGDDSAMGVVTCYSDHQTGETKLVSFGQTLLEDHTPSAIGNHLSILTKEEDQITENVKKLIKEIGWTGFSNYDVKYDKRDHTYKFFELNARLGRSNYYVTAAGKNTAEYYVADYLESADIPYSVSEKQVLYSVLPKKLLLENIESKQLKNTIKDLYKAKQVFHPLDSPDEKSLKRKWYVRLSTLNYFKKFKSYPQNH